MFCITYIDCNSQKKIINTEEIATPRVISFNEVIFAEGGDFLGLTLGEPKESVMSKLPNDAFEDEQENWLYYSWKIGNNNYYLDLFFNEDSTLFSIAGYIYLNTENGDFDNEAATTLFTDLKPYFLNKFGTPEIEDAYYVPFYSDTSNVDLGKGDGEVYFYVAQLKNDDIFCFEHMFDGIYFEDELLEKRFASQKPISFNDIIFAEGGDFLGLTLGETKESIISKLPKDAFEDEQENWLYYSWKIGNHDYYLDLSFSEDNTLFSISGYINLNNPNGSYDNESAIKLYAELKPYFVNKFGEPIIEYTDKLEFYINESIVELGKDYGEITFYMVQF